MVGGKLKEEGQVRVDMGPGSRWRRMRGEKKLRIECIEREISRLTDTK